MAIVKSISVSKEFAHIADELGLSWTELARIGASIKFADLGLIEYNNKLNLVRKMRVFQNIAEAANQELDGIKNGNGDKTNKNL